LNSYKSNLFILKDDITDDPFVIEKELSDMGLSVQLEASYELVPSILLMELPDLKILNNLDIDIILKENGSDTTNKVEKIKNLVKLILLKYLLNNSGLDSRIKKVKELLEISEINFKVVLIKQCFIELLASDGGLNKMSILEDDSYNCSEYEKYKTVWRVKEKLASDEYKSAFLLLGLSGFIEYLS